MDCREVRQLADAFVSEQLLVETTRTIVAHVERCRSCESEIDGLRRVRGATKAAFEAAPELTVNPAFVATLTTRLRSEANGRQGWRGTRRAWLALAASVLLLVGAGLGWRVWSTSGLFALLQDAAGDHQFCALTFKLAERPIPLEEAARRYGGVYRLLQTVEPSSTGLSGGPLRVAERHVCVFNGRRFTHIVLVYKDTPVSLLVADEPWSLNSPATPSELPVTDGFHVVSFAAPRHAVFVVSSLPGSDVQDVAEVMAAPVMRALSGV